MAGSLEVFVYTTDAGGRYLVKLDESNATAAGFPQAVSADGNLPVLPGRIKMRVVNCVSETGIRRRIPVPTVTSDLWKGTTRTIGLIVVTGLTGSEVTFTVSSRTGERETYLTFADTGQTDAPGVGQSPAGSAAAP